MVIKRTVEDRLAVLESRFSEDHEPFNSPAELAAHITNGGYQIPPHIELINNKVLDAVNGKTQRLCIFCPPRHGKSTLISLFLPVWYLHTHPHNQVILCSYSDDFAASWGRKVRNTIKENEERLGIMLDESSAAVNRFHLSEYGGGMVTAGVGGAITGRGADLLILDDVVKNAEDANSQTIRERTWEWYISTAYTRLNPGDTPVILIMTRWHQDDLASRLLTSMEDGSGDTWEVVNLPAFAVEDDILGRKPGEALWPDRFPVDVLNQKKKVLGSYYFSAMYQQRPQPPGGGLLKKAWLRYYDRPPRDLVHYMGADLAISTKESSDYTCTAVVGVDQGNGDCYVLDLTRSRITFPEQLALIKRKASEFNPALIALESTAYQAALPQMLRKETNLPIREVKPFRDKVTRITSRFVMFENGKVFLPKSHLLLENFIDEYIYFPKGKHDDLLDAVEIALSLASMAANPFTESSVYYEDSRGVDRLKGFERRRWRRENEVRI